MQEEGLALEISNEVKELARAILEKKAEKVLAIYVGKLLGITDYFLIATINNPVQAEAVVSAVEEMAEKLGLSILSISGSRESVWILLDLGDVVVHLFTPEGRDYYRLENLWKDCPAFEFTEGAKEPTSVSLLQHEEAKQ